MTRTQDIDALAGQLAPHYSNFRVQDRLLFTGHSHQAWPDVAREGLLEAFDTAADAVDLKWKKAFEKVEVLRNYLRDFYDDPDGWYGHGLNTHQLLVSWLSALDLRNKPRIVTTDSEFHSMYRQLKRLEEEGLEVVRIPVQPLNTFLDRLEPELTSDTAALMLSRIYYISGLVQPHLHSIASLARERQVPLLIDDYHGTNVRSLSLREEQLDDCYLLIGGYKYLQWGEGNCFIRYPKHCALRPAITGWFAAFQHLDEPRTNNAVSFDEGNDRFASGTFDPSPAFRAARVEQFFRDHHLTPEVLESQYRAQVQLMRQLLLEADIDANKIHLYHRESLDFNGGFLAFRSPKARQIRQELLQRDVYTDARGDVLRMGPAPYITSGQIEEAMNHLIDIAG